MKQKFSLKWNRSKQRRKQRKYLANAPLHIRHKLMAAGLSEDLIKKYNRGGFPVRKGDTVKVLIGKFKGKTGKVSIVNLKKLKINIEGLQIQKKDGTKINVAFNPGNIEIQEIILEDRKRLEAINRKKKENKEEKKENKEEIQDAPKKNTNK